jgi:hypothetical protein
MQGGKNWIFAKIDWKFGKKPLVSLYGTEWRERGSFSFFWE